MSTFYAEDTYPATYWQRKELVRLTKNNMYWDADMMQGWAGREIRRLSNKGGDAKTQVAPSVYHNEARRI